MVNWEKNVNDDARKPIQNLEQQRIMSLMTIQVKELVKILADKTLPEK